MRQIGKPRSTSDRKGFLTMDNVYTGRRVAPATFGAPKLPPLTNYPSPLNMAAISAAQGFQAYSQPGGYDEDGNYYPPQGLYSTAVVAAIHPGSRDFWIVDSVSGVIAVYSSAGVFRYRMTGLGSQALQFSPAGDCVFANVLGNTYKANQATSLRLKDGRPDGQVVAPGGRRTPDLVFAAGAGVIWYQNAVGAWTNFDPRTAYTGMEAAGQWWGDNQWHVASMAPDRGMLIRAGLHNNRAQRLIVTGIPTSPAAFTTGARGQSFAYNETLSGDRWVGDVIWTPDSQYVCVVGFNASDMFVRSGNALTLAATLVGKCVTDYCADGWVQQDSTGAIKTYSFTTGALIRTTAITPAVAMRPIGDGRGTFVSSGGQVITANYPDFARI